MTTAPDTDKQSGIVFVDSLESLLPSQPADRKPVEDQAQPVDRRIARLQARAAERRNDRHDAVQTWAEGRRARREDRKADREDRRALRAEKRLDRSERNLRIRNRIITAFQRFIVVGPIIAPMAVAWTGQSQFAVHILGWAFIASVLYAAAYELTTAYWAWLYHQARSDGDSGWEYRTATWVFAVGAAVQQWWHYSDHWNATPRSVTYSAMSAVGVLMWEGYARLIHRRRLRSDGKIPAVRPRIGLVRWTRYPVRSWTAWSLTILEGHRTVEAAWTAAEDRIRSSKADRTARSMERTGRRRTARLDRADRSTDRDNKKTDRTVNEIERSAAMDRADRTGPEKRSAIAPTRADRGPKELPAARSTDRTADPVRADNSDGPDQRSADNGPAEMDRTDSELVLTEQERTAIELLRSTNRSISKRSISDVVRRELGGSIASDRAVQIARHYRALRSAA